MSMLLKTHCPNFRIGYFEGPMCCLDIFSKAAGVIISDEKTVTLIIGQEEFLALLNMK